MIRPIKHHIIDEFQKDHIHEDYIWKILETQNLELLISQNGCHKHNPNHRLEMI